MRSNQWTTFALTIAVALALSACGGEGGEVPPEEGPMAEAPLAGDEPLAAAQEPEEGPQNPAPQPVFASLQLPEGVTKELVRHGREIYSGIGNCYSCHGANAMGTALAPSQVDTVFLNIPGTYESIVQVISTGVPQPVEHPAPMPPEGGADLSAQQVRAVGAYIYAISHGKIESAT